MFLEKRVYSHDRPIDRKVLKESTGRNIWPGMRSLSRNTRLARSFYNKTYVKLVLLVRHRYIIDIKILFIIRNINAPHLK